MALGPFLLWELDRHIKQIFWVQKRQRGTIVEVVIICINKDLLTIKNSSKGQRDFLNALMLIKLVFSIYSDPRTGVSNRGSNSIDSIPSKLISTSWWKWMWKDFLISVYPSTLRKFYLKIDRLHPKPTSRQTGLLKRKLLCWKWTHPSYPNAYIYYRIIQRIVKLIIIKGDELISKENLTNNCFQEQSFVSNVAV